MTATTDLLRGELEKHFDLDGLKRLSGELLGFDPEDVGSTSGKGAFARALVERCAREDALEALVDALLLSAKGVVHTHFLQGQAIDPAEVNAPSPTVVLGKSLGANAYAPRSSGNIVNMNVQETSIAGGSLPHNNMSPYLTVNFCIAMQGVFPARP